MPRERRSDIDLASVDLSAILWGTAENNDMPPPPQREASDVVELRPSARERSHRRLDARGPLRRAGAVAFFGQQTFEAILPELERVRVLSFGHAIGVEK